MMGDEGVVHQGVFLTHCPVVLKVNKLFEIERKSSALCIFLKMSLLSRFLLEATQINEMTSSSGCCHWCTCRSHGGGRAAYFESWSGPFWPGSSFLVLYHQQLKWSYEEGKMRKYLVGVLGVAGFRDENVTSSLPHFRLPTSHQNAKFP